MTIPPRFLDDIRSRLSLSDVIGKRVRLTRAGREYKGCCPFHKEKSPSFTVNDDKQFFHCFGCGAHGDVIGFVMRYENLSFIEAVESLAGQAGLQVPKPSPQDIQKAEKARDLHALIDSATRWMEEQLFAPANKEILNYLTGRGLSKETIQSFRIGYAPPDRQALRKFLLAEKFTDEQIFEAGLVRKKDGEPPYAFFRERVMFPVGDRRGRIVAFGGRILPDHMREPDKGDYKPAKYMNSSDTPLFDKSRTLYGQSFARQAARDGATVLVTEGYMDVIACHQAGFKGAVAPMGTALTEDQIVMLWSMIVAEEKIPVLCFDGDNAGRGAAVRACERILPLLKPYHSARFAFMPEGEDPDTLIKAGGAKAFQNILDTAIPLFDFLWLAHTGGRNFDSPESRAGVVKALENSIRTISDGEVQRHYQEHLRRKVGEVFFNRSRAAGPRDFNKPVRPGMRPQAPGAVRQKDERSLLAAIINHPHIYEAIEQPLGQFDFRNPACDRVRQVLLGAFSHNPDLDGEGLQNHLESQGLAKELSDILNESVYRLATFAGPRADPGSVAQTWLALYRDYEGEALKQEVRSGWKQAFQMSSEDDEQRLRTMVELKAGERS
ncbi:MAG TPA: DNA primase [Alphaproteobacteria bacterium]|nr:DNA primase [Alphaproteobacteria bacterium]